LTTRRFLAVVLLVAGAAWWASARARFYDLDADGTIDSIEARRWVLHAFVTRGQPVAAPAGASGRRSRGYNIPPDYIHALAGMAFTWDPDWRVIEADPALRVTSVLRVADGARLALHVHDWRGRAWVSVTEPDQAAASGDVAREALDCLEALLFSRMPKGLTIEGFAPPP
jgi:hypothetical protein